MPQGAGLHKRQEREANQFAIELLAPPLMMRPVLDIDPDLNAIAKLSGRLDISMEAAIRRFIELHDEPIAAVWSRNGVCHKAARFIANCDIGTTDWVQTDASHWTGAHGIEMFEQTRLGSNGHAAILLWATLPDTDGEAGIEEPGMPSFLPR